MKKIALALAGASVALTGLAVTPAAAADFNRHDRGRYEQVQTRTIERSRFVRNDNRFRGDHRFQQHRWNRGDRFDHRYAANYLEDILTLARVGRSREQFERADVSEIARSLAADYRELGKQVTFTADGEYLLDVQPNLFRRALRNLVDNALKYAGSAEVEVGSDGESVTIAVLDRGPGLPPGELERITGAFYRAEPSRNRETGGAGLGLSIAQAVVDAHGGSLTFANRAAGGLVARISLPKA